MSLELDLEPARSVLQADGIDIELIRMDGEAAQLLMSVVDAECAECVLPRPMLESVVLDLLRTGRPSLRALSIVDRRESEGERVGPSRFRSATTAHQ